jgi:hypothetical protein
MLSTPPEDALVGRWGKVQGEPRVLVDLQPNGLGHLFLSACIWIANEHELRLGGLGRLLDRGSRQFQALGPAAS